MKTLILYFSYSNNTKNLVEKVNKEFNFDVARIERAVPYSDDYNTCAYGEAKDEYDQDKIKAIGVSNLGPDRLVDICRFARTKPMVNQIETNPFNAQKAAHKWLTKYNVVHEAWAPLGEKRNGLFDNETLDKIAKSHNKTVAQVILRWELQNDVVVIPKSTHKERMQENFNILDFKLTDNEMKQIDDLDTNASLFFSHYDPKMVEWFADMVKPLDK